MRRRRRKKDEENETTQTSLTNRTLDAWATHPPARPSSFSCSYSWSSSRCCSCCGSCCCSSPSSILSSSSSRRVSENNTVYTVSCPPSTPPERPRLNEEGRGKHYSLPGFVALPPSTGAPPERGGYQETVLFTRLRFLSTCPPSSLLSSALSCVLTRSMRFSFVLMLSCPMGPTKPLISLCGELR